MSVRTNILLASLLLFASACSESPGDGPGGPGGMGPDDMPPAQVTLGSPERQDLSHYANHMGRVHGEREVEVRARVSGILLERRFAEGDAVEQGETLFQIDPEPFEIALAMAESDHADAEANLQRAEGEWQRVENLHQNNAASSRQRDQARADRLSAEANVQRAEAALRDARRNLRYARVEAPVAGVAGIEAVSEGNLIDAGTLLTRVTQLDTVRIHFAMPERHAQIQQRSLAEGAAYAGGERDAEHAADAEHAQHIPVWLLDNGREGRIDFRDSRIDAATGTVAMRARFDNADGALIPGQFLRLRVLLQRFENTIAIDETVVSEGPEGPQVFVYNGDGTVNAQAVQLGPVIDGQQVILDGLDGDEQIVINGHVTLLDGAEVIVSNGEG